MKACPVCETQNQPGAKNCDCCGEPLAIPQSVQASGAPAAPSPKREEAVAEVTTAAPVPTVIDDAPTVRWDASTVAQQDATLPMAVPAAPPEPPPPRTTGPALVVFQNRAAVFKHFIVNDETLIGRADPISGSYPDLDLTTFDPEHATSRKHAFVYRQDGKIVVRAITNAGTQVNQDLLNMGDQRELKEGDVLILGGKIALKFEIAK